MKRAISILFAAAAVGIPGVATASARTSYPTTITHDSAVALGGGTVVDSGHLGSRFHLCVFLRPVKLIGHYPDGTTQLLDVDITSAKGAWATRADETGADRVKAKAIRVAGRLRPHGPRKVCQPAAIVFPAP